MKKKKVLVLSDHALSTSGVGTQTRHLLMGLIEKGCWSFRQFGAAMRHEDYNVVKVNDDLIIKPVDGFGSRDLLLKTILSEKPDAILIFTDPRFFVWLFEMEDEIHQICPIFWWHVWDNVPYPMFNNSFYEATDLINCHSHATYMMIKDRFPEKTNFVPHAVPEEIFRRLDQETIDKFKKQLLAGREDHFIGCWINRNAKRKRPNDLLEAWKIFLDKLEEKEGHRKATLIMHTDPRDGEGPNLFANVQRLDIENNVTFSTDRIGFDEMNVIYNISDFCINISFAEGFGLSTLESMMSGTPIVAIKTGGLTRQVVDYRDETENGVALPVEFRTTVGSQLVPYIYEDYVSTETIANGIMKLYDLGPIQKEALSNKVYDYAHEQFGLQQTVDLWHEKMLEKIENWKSKYKRWEMVEL